MTKEEVLTEVTTLGTASVQEIDSGATYETMEDADAQMDTIRAHLAQLVIDGDVTYVAPASGEVEKWQAV